MRVEVGEPQGTCGNQRLRVCARDTGRGVRRLYEISGMAEKLWRIFVT